MVDTNEKFMGDLGVPRVYYAGSEELSHKQNRSDKLMNSAAFFLGSTILIQSRDFYTFSATEQNYQPLTKGNTLGQGC